MPAHHFHTKKLHGNVCRMSQMNKSYGKINVLGVLDHLFDVSSSMWVMWTIQHSHLNITLYALSYIIFKRLSDRDVGVECNMAGCWNLLPPYPDIGCLSASDLCKDDIKRELLSKKWEKAHLFSFPSSRYIRSSIKLPVML